MKGIQVFFFIGGVMSSLSVLLYLVVPAGTAKFFSGEDAPSVYTQFWVEVVASGDALVAFLCFTALFRNAEFKRFVIWAMFVYWVFHGGAFLHGHFVYHPIPKYMLASCLQGVVVSLVATLYWGVFRPPKDDVDPHNNNENDQVKKDN